MPGVSPYKLQYITTKTGDRPGFPARSRADTLQTNSLHPCLHTTVSVQRGPGYYQLPNSGPRVISPQATRGTRNPRSSSCPQRAFRREELIRPSRRTSIRRPISVTVNLPSTQNTAGPDYLPADGDSLNDSSSPLVGKKHDIDHVQNSIICLEVRIFKGCVPNLNLRPVLPDLDVFPAEHS